MGHLIRARCVASRMATPPTIFSSRPGAEVLPLDVDSPRSLACAAAPKASGFHYAPLGVPGIRRRMAMIADWVAHQDPDVFVVDVSVEVAAYLRLMSVPTIVVRQHGRRDDPAHLMCYRNATSLLAPYPSLLEEEWVPLWLRAKTTYTGGFSRFDGRGVDRAAARSQRDLPDDRPTVLVLPGEGGASGMWPVQDAARATPGWHWATLGTHWPPMDHVRNLGWIDDPFEWLCAADVIVTHAGHNALMECASVGANMIVIPQDRPYDEQRHKARRLAEADLGLVRDIWPAASEWARLLRQALDRPSRDGLVDGRGADRAAGAIDAVSTQMAGHASVNS